MKLRPYRSSDLNAMVALDDICFAPAFRFTRSAMRSFAESKHARVMVAETGGRLVGFVILHVQGRPGYVVTLDVAPAHRRKGLATRLISEVASQARSSGCHQMTLHVYSGNAAAVRFYERLGFSFHTIVSGFYGKGLDALEYRILLGPV